MGCGPCLLVGLGLQPVVGMRRGNLRVEISVSPLTASSPVGAAWTEVRGQPPNRWVKGLGWSCACGCAQAPQARWPAGSACWLCTWHAVESAQREGHHFLILYVLSRHQAALSQDCTDSDKGPFLIQPKTLLGQLCSWVWAFQSWYIWKGIPRGGGGKQVRFHGFCWALGGMTINEG